MIRTYLARAKKQSLKAIYWLVDQMGDTEHYHEYTHFVNGFENPNYRFDKSKIGFIHLPKTAGTSFSKLLRNDPAEQFALLRIHRPVSMHCSPENYRYITVVRDPIDRVWSLYNMILRYPKKYPYWKHAVRGLEPFLQKNRAARNLACRYLSGKMEPEPTAATVDEAMENLSRFYAVISFENFAEEATRFLEKHQVPFEKIPNERKAKYEPPTAEEIEIIKKYNAWDIELYRRWEISKKQLEFPKS